MPTREKEIDVAVPVSTAYNQWTQFESFPKFMDGVKEVKQIDDTHLAWRAEVGGKEKTWEAEITEQVPDQRISWHSTGGAPNAGIVTFDPIDEGASRVRLQIQYEPEGLMESTGDLLGIMDQQVESSLNAFKEFIESMGEETGAWRGSV